MTDKRLTDNEIIKALMCFSFWHEGCEKCPYLKRCNKVKRMLTIIDTIDALDLINRQKAEIERLSNSAKQWEDTAKDLFISKENAKAEVTKEFADKIKDKFDKHGVDYTAYVIVDDVAKEMVG